MDHTTDFIKVLIWGLSGPLIDTLTDITKRGLPFFLQVSSLCWSLWVCEVVLLFWILVLMFIFGGM